MNSIVVLRETRREALSSLDEARRQAMEAQELIYKYSPDTKSTSEKIEIQLLEEELDLLQQQEDVLLRIVANVDRQLARYTQR